MFKFLKKTQAFTLIEMLLVLLIISEAYALKHNRNPSSIEDLIADGFIKEAQKTCKSGESITISNGEAVAN